MPTVARFLPVVAAAALTAPLLALGGSQVSAATPPPFNTIWTADSAANSITEYAAGAHGAATPIATISGADTKLDAPSAVQVGPLGDVLVANRLGNSITEYAAGSTGDAKPIGTISGSQTGLDGPSSIALAGGLIWTTDPSTNIVEGFTVSLHGNVLPAMTIQGKRTGLNHPIALVASVEFPFVTVLNAPVAGGGDLELFEPGTFGNIAPLQTMKGTKKAPFKDPTALTQRDEFSVLVADAGTNSLSEYLALPGFGTASVRRIAGSATGISDPTAISHDAAGRIYESNGSGNVVNVFNPEAHGNVAPVSTLTGVGTAASEPTAFTVYGTVPAEPTDLKAVRHGRQVHLTWSPPAVSGGDIVGYEVIESQESDNGIDSILSLLGLGGSVSSSGSLSGSSGDAGPTTKTFATRTIKPGVRYDFNVIAINGFGEGHQSATVHAAIVRPPGRPTSINALTHGHQMFLGWQPPSRDGGATHLRYKVEYATCVPGAADCTFKTKRSKIEFTILKHLKEHAKYDVRVIAINSAGAGKPSTVKRVKLK